MQLNLIHFLDFYLILMFLAGVVRRLDQYRNVGKLVISGPTRWPKLLLLVREQRMIFMTWGTVLPALLAAALSVIQLIASRLVWPEAGNPPNGLTIERVFDVWPVLIVLLPLGIAMVAFDGYTLYRGSEVNRELLESHFDQAEYWLKSKTAHVVRVVTFGFVNPRKMVVEEVRKALIAVSDLLNFQLWWISTQIGLRFAFGLALWLTWAFCSPHLAEMGS